jgi:hypothetical protein
MGRGRRGLCGDEPMYKVGAQEVWSAQSSFRVHVYSEGARQLASLGSYCFLLDLRWFLEPSSTHCPAAGALSQRAATPHCNGIRAWGDVPLMTPSGRPAAAQLPARQHTRPASTSRGEQACFVEPGGALPTCGVYQPGVPHYRQLRVEHPPEDSKVPAAGQDTCQSAAPATGQGRGGGKNRGARTLSTAAWQPAPASLRTLLQPPWCLRRVL